jgi:hypothetical protein
MLNYPHRIFNVCVVLIMRYSLDLPSNVLDISFISIFIVINVFDLSLNCIISTLYTF